MNIKVLELHLVETEKTLSKVQNNVYSDKAKQDYQQNLVLLFNAIKDDISRANQEHDPIQKYAIIEFLPPRLHFIFKSLEFLDNSTLNLIPYELVKCLEFALKDWVSDAHNYIIVTSQVNQVSFSFDPSSIYDKDVFYEMIEEVYGIKLSHRLIQINIPKFLVRDYLACVIMYHELGHFIDIKLKIVEGIVSTITQKEKNDPNFTNYFPQSNDGHIKTYLREYFCDLFAAQYVGNSCNEYLEYLTGNTKRSYLKHPSTEKRLEIINDFLEQKTNIVIDLIQNALGQMLGEKRLEKRFEDLDCSDFYKLLPLEINSPKELHGLFPLAWKIWLGKWDNFEHINSSNEDKIYTILNNLVEKSIGNYIVLEQWNKHHSQEH